jgi:hypothetical protein
MKEILQLFRRDAEHDPVSARDAKTYDLGSKPRILKESGSAYGSGTNTRETTVSRERTPEYGRPESAMSKKKEDAVYGRRW